MSETGRIGQAPWGAVLGRPGGEDGSAGPVPGTVVVTAPITGDGSAGTPVGVSAATETARGTMSAADKLKLDTLVANQASTLVRYFLLDYDGGSDAQVGFLDAAAGSVLAPAGIPFKTFEQLFVILAKLGAALPVVILVKNRAAGATYLQKDGVTPSDVDLSGLAGYASVDIRGSSDLSNDATDRIAAGAIQGQAGPGGGGVWTCAGGATTTVFSVSAGALTAEPANIGMRVRFTGNVTAGLANVCAYISANTATQITVGAAITAPAAGDTFTIEIPGVRVNTLCLAIASPGGRGITARAMRQTAVGIAVVRDTVNSFVVGGPADTQVAFCETTGTASVTHAVAEGMDSLSVAKTYTDETNTARVVGLGLRVRGDFLFQNILNLIHTESAHISSTATLTGTRWIRIGTGTIGQFGMYLGRGAQVLQSGFRMGHPTGFPLLFGGGRQGSLIACRCIGPLNLSQSEVTVAGVDITQAGATGALTVASPSVSYSLNVDRISGSTGNTGVGLDLLGASRTRLLIGTAVACTVTGAAGDVKLPSSVITSYVALTTVPPFLDSNLNTIIGGAPTRCQDIAIVLTNGDGTAHVVGDVVRQSAASTCLRAEADTAAHAAGPLLVAVTPAASGAAGYYVPLSGNLRLLNFDGAPTSLAIAYLSTGTAGNATTTVPVAAVTNQKRRLGLVQIVSGTTAIVQCVPDNLSVNADGNP